MMKTPLTIFKCLTLFLLASFSLAKAVPCMSKPCQFKIPPVGSNSERIKHFLENDINKGEDHCELSLTNVRRLGNLMFSKQAHIGEFLDIVVPRVTDNDSKEFNSIIEELSKKFNLEKEKFFEEKQKFYSKKECQIEPTIKNFTTKCKEEATFGNPDDIMFLRNLLFGFTDEETKLKFSDFMNFLSDCKPNFLSNRQGNMQFVSQEFLLTSFIRKLEVIDVTKGEKLLLELLPLSIEQRGKTDRFYRQLIMQKVLKHIPGIERPRVIDQIYQKLENQFTDGAADKEVYKHEKEELRELVESIVKRKDEISKSLNQKHLTGMDPPQELINSHYWKEKDEKNMRENQRMYALISKQYAKKIRDQEWEKEREQRRYKFEPTYK